MAGITNFRSVRERSDSVAPYSQFLACLCSVLTAVCLLAGSTHNLSAQETKKKDEEELAAPVDETVFTADGVAIRMTYYKSRAGKESPVIILLHMKDSNQFVWHNGFADRLQENDFAVITVDLRGHGESKGGGGGNAPAGNANQDAGKKKAGEKKPTKKASGKVESTTRKPNDYLNMAEQDMEAVKKFIFQEHQAENLNMNKIGIVGPEMGASVAAYFAAEDWNKRPYPDGQEGFRTPRGQDVRAIVLISPQKDTPLIPISKPLTSLREPSYGVAFLLCVGKNDVQDKGETKKLFKQITNFPKNDERMYLYEYDSKERGTDLLDKKNVKVEDAMLGFFTKHLKKLPNSPWRDRRSKLEKKKAG